MQMRSMSFSVDLGLPDLQVNVGSNIALTIESDILPSSYEWNSTSRFIRFCVAESNVGGSSLMPSVAPQLIP